MSIFRDILLILLVICAVGASLSKRLLTSVVIFMSYSITMSVVWILLAAPDHQVDTDRKIIEKEKEDEK